MTRLPLRVSDPGSRGINNLPTVFLFVFYIIPGTLWTPLTLSLDYFASGFRLIL